MKRNHAYHRWPLALLIFSAALMGCGAGARSPLTEPPAVHLDGFIGELTPDIEELYLSWHELDRIYQDIKFLERGFLFDPEVVQLGYIQKASLYLQDASVRIHNRWEQLSVLHYIQPAMVRDYLTLTVKGLSTTLDAIAYDRMFLEIYAAFIEEEAVIADLTRARNQMDTIKGTLQRIRQQLVPVANSVGPSPTI